MKRTSIAFIAFTSTVAFLAGCAAPAVNVNVNSPTNSNANVRPANVNTNTNVANSNTTASTGKPFSKTVELHGIKFVVESPNTATGNTVTIKPSGLEVSNEEVKRDVSGEVTEAEVGDLNVDQSPEVYVYVTKSGAEKGTQLIAYATNNKKSMSEINLAAPDMSSPDFKGYRGENEFRVVENSLIQRFPIFDGDKKTGKMRQIQYKLKPGEAAWQLVKDKTIEF